MTVSKIWVFAEASEGKATTSTLEMLAKAGELADSVECVATTADLAAEVGAHGASKLFTVAGTDGKLAGPIVASAIAAAIDAGNGPDAVMLATSYEGRDVAGRLSVKVDAPVITNVVDLVERDGHLAGVEPVFGGTQNVITKFTSDKVGIFLVRPKSFAAAEAPSGAAAATEDLAAGDLGNTGTATVTNRFVEEHSGPSLDDAAVVVSGGRGLGEDTKFEMIEELAKLLGGAPGASRAIVDAGWVPYSYQVGQTGKVVKPTVYVAAGISGATQHLVGMKGSKNIIAINKDPEAPIFSVADLGIVGDVHKVIPALIEAIKAR